MSLSLPAYGQKIGGCMTYRSDIVWIESTETTENILILIKTHENMDYFPVCAGSIDAVIGIVSARNYLQNRLKVSPLPLREILTNPLFIPESQTIEKTIALLTTHAAGAACVIDEYGGLEGFVTKAGLLEALFIKGLQRSGTTEKLPIKQADGSLIVNAQRSIDELHTLCLLEDITSPPADEYYTLAGYLLAHLDTIPHEGDIVDTGAYLCTILSMKGQRIDRILIKKKN